MTVNYHTPRVASAGPRVANAGARMAVVERLVAARWQCWYCWHAFDRTVARIVAPREVRDCGGVRRPAKTNPTEMRL
jgi:hypothetical protein